MHKQRVLLVGFGKLARELAPLLVGDGYCVTGVKRTISADKKDNIEMIYLNISNKEQLNDLPTDFDQVIITLTPSDRSETGYLNTYFNGTRNLLEHFSNQGSLAKFVLVSSTRVYQQSLGEWVNENSLATNSDSKAVILKKTEELLWQFDPKHVVLRLSGIYGGDRNHLLNRVKNGLEVQRKPAYFTNRVHQQDAVGVIRFIIHKQEANVPLDNLYLINDDLPAPLWDVAIWIAKEYFFESPKEVIKLDTAQQNKRCDNSKIKSLGYSFKFSSYKEGYSN